MVCIELSAMNILVQHYQGEMILHWAMTHRALAKNPESMRASGTVVCETSADGHGILVNQSS